MNYIASKKVQLVAEFYFEKYVNALNSNSDFETIKVNYEEDVKNQCYSNSIDQEDDNGEFENKIKECIIFYINLLEKKFMGLEPNG